MKLEEKFVATATGKLPMKKLIMTVIIGAAKLLVSLIIVCTTTMVLLLIVAYKIIMRKYSSKARSKVNRVDQVSSKTVDIENFCTHTEQEISRHSSMESLVLSPTWEYKSDELTIDNYITVPSSQEWYPGVTDLLTISSTYGVNESIL